MAYGNAKVYFDGSHYIAIPHTERPSKRRYRVVEEEIAVVPKKQEESVTDGKREPLLPSSVEASTESIEKPSCFCFDETTEEKNISTETSQETNEKTPRQAGVPMTRKELFDQLYQIHLFKKRSERERVILAAMLPYFPDEKEAKYFVEANMERRRRNLITRRVRLTRKINLQSFNYFCTFTYDDRLHSEESFRSGLKTTFGNLTKRRGWKYIGVWERSPEKQRLHFHGLFQIPIGTIPGGIVRKNDYNFKAHDRKETHQSTYFLEHFGRNDFDLIAEPGRIGEAVAYLMKYIEKTGEKIVYSRGLPQFFLSDILEDDVVTTCGLEDKKLLLFDDFSCFDEGCYVGQVSPAVICRLKKTN